MANRIDTDKLGQHIGELNALCQEWNGYAKKPEDIGENSGRTADQVVEMSKSLQSIQDGFVSLLSNTVSYLSQRKDSVDTKEAAATAQISK